MPASSASREKSACRFGEPALQDVVAADVLEREARRDELEDALLARHLFLLRQDLAGMRASSKATRVAKTLDRRWPISSAVKAPERERRRRFESTRRDPPWRAPVQAGVEDAATISPSSGSSYSTT